MKVIREESEEKKTITIRLSERVKKQIDDLSEENDVSRQRLIEAILEQALNDKSFTLRIK